MHPSNLLVVFSQFGLPPVLSMNLVPPGFRRVVSVPWDIRFTAFSFFPSWVEGREDAGLLATMHYCRLFYLLPWALFLSILMC
jgi:hypothetical protein